MTHRRLGFTSAIAIVAGLLASCATPDVRQHTSSSAVAAPEANTDTQAAASYLSDLNWRFIGPMRGGRVNAVAGHPTERLTFYAGYTGGGVWRTQNAGVSWQNLSDGYFGVGSIGAIAIAPSNPDIIYVGTGEHALRGDASYGDGVYKSVDGGDTWTHIGLTDTRQIARIVVHPTDPNRVTVAAIGGFGGPSADRGVFRSTDGGATWDNTLFVNETTGAVGLAIDPTRPNVMFAATWDIQRYPWGVRSAGPGSGLHRSTDGGVTWTSLSGNTGLPGGVQERIGLDYTAADGGRIWALISSETERGLYLSDDDGETWRKTSDEKKLFGRPYYFNKIAADPTRADTIYVLGFPLLRSDDGGVTFVELPEGHADHHAFWIDPNDADRIIDGTDGGAAVSLDGASSWSTLFNQPTGQLYDVTTDHAEPYNLYGAQQDWGALRIASRARGSDLPNGGVTDIEHSEAGRIAIDPTDPNMIFLSDHHWLIRSDIRTGSADYVGPRDETNYGWGLRDVELRFNWTFPIAFSQHERRTLFAGSQYLHRSRDGGYTWETISPDLTRADPATLEITPLPGRDTSDNGPFWGPITRDSNGDHWFATLFVIAESPRARGVIWTGSDDGRAHLTTDGGDTWTDVTPPDLPELAKITAIAPSPHNPAIAYLAAARHKFNDYAPYLYTTTDYGRTWSSITHGLDTDEVVRSVVVDPVRPGLVFVGTEAGLYLSFDAGSSWARWNNNLPPVPVYDMTVQGDDLVLATHGRGFWALDDISLLRQLTDQTRTAPAHLFAPHDTVRWTGSWAEGAEPGGVTIRYHLAALTERDIALRIETPDGAVVANIDDSDLSTATGLNTFVWDLRGANAVEVPGVMTRGNPRVAPRVTPGSYRAVLTVDGEELRQAFTLRIDPRSNASQADLKEQFAFLSSIRDEINAINQAVIDVRDLRARLMSQEVTGDDVDAVFATFTAVEEAFVQIRAEARKDLHANPVMLNDKFYRLSNWASSADARPQPSDYALLEEFSAQAAPLLERMSQATTLARELLSELTE